MSQWWEWLTVGLLLATAGLYLTKLAGKSVGRWVRGQGCGGSRPGCGTGRAQHGAARPRELVQLTVELQPSQRAGQ